MIRVTHLSHSDGGGGAARAALRIHQALRAHGQASRLLVTRATSGESGVETRPNRLPQTLSLLRLAPGEVLRRFCQRGGPEFQSHAIMPSAWSRWLTATKADLVHLHWINHEMMSIPDIGRLPQPVVWTLHDMWPFSGAEHFSSEARWRDGYSPRSRPVTERGWDLNRWTWQRKRRHWRRPMHVVAPSRWLAECARQSTLMQDWPVTVIPYPIDTEVWKPEEKPLARHLLRLPTGVPLVLFGAWGGGADPRKGFDLLLQALLHLQGRVPKLEVVVFGQRFPEDHRVAGFPTHGMGHLHDDLTLRLLYSAADVMVVPSRQDNLPNTAIESLACGTPVVAFKVGGLPDIVRHQQTGWLAPAFDSEHLAAGIAWVLADAARHRHMQLTARQHAVRCYAASAIANQYQAVYHAALRPSRSRWVGPRHEVEAMRTLPAHLERVSQELSSP